MSPSRLPTQVMARARRYVVGDHAVHVDVWRDEALVANFQTRIAPASSGVAGRDSRPVQGDASPNYYTMAAPTEADVQPRDEVWEGEKRYRVVTVDRYPHELQVLIEHIQ